MAMSADAAEHWARSTMTLQVEPDQLLVWARHLDGIANRGQSFLESDADRLTFDPMGADAVSTSVANRMSLSATGEAGLVPALQRAVENLRATAEQARVQAAEYGFTDETNAGRLDAAGGDS